MKILIVDDDPIVAQSLATILSAETDIEVAGIGASGEEAVRLFTEVAPDILLMDIRMPGGSGLEAAEEILAAHDRARIVFLTTFSDDEYIVRALQMGARGYLIKQDIAQIAPALRSVMAGVCVLEGQVMERSTIVAPTQAVTHQRNTIFARLTDREYEVVEAVAQGLDNAQVAERLFMSEGTVRNHISTVLAKTGLRNRTQVAVAWYRSELPN